MQEWVHCVKNLTKATQSQPQVAQMALIKSLQFKWPTYREWSLNVLMPLHHCRTLLTTNFAPQCLGNASLSRRRSCSPCLNALKTESLTPSGVSTINFLHSVLVKATVKIEQSIKGEEEFSVLAHKAVIVETQ